MAINIGDFINLLKREGRYGAAGVVDQAQADILNSINMRGARIWAFADWKWIMESLSFAIAANNNSYVVAAASGNPIDRIHSIIPYDPTVTPPMAGRPLQEMEIEDFYAETQNVVPAITGAPRKYCNLGMNATFSWQILIWPTPSVAFTMTGYAKAVLSTYLAADVVANIALKYFPNGVVLDALFAGCMIDIDSIQGMLAPQRLVAEQAWTEKLKALKAEQSGVARDNSPITTPPPPWWSRRNAMRSKKGSGVY